MIDGQATGSSAPIGRDPGPIEEHTVRSTSFGDWLSVDTQDIRLTSARRMTAHVVRFPPIALVVALYGESVVLIRQFRFPSNSWLIEAPAGRVEKNEHPAEAARRELREETGFLAGKLERIGQLRISPHLSDEITYMYLATELTRGAPSLDTGELIRKFPVRRDNVRAMVEHEEIVDAKTIAALSIARII